MIQKIREKYFEKWLPGYMAHLVRRALNPTPPGPKHLLFALCDHHEPLWNDVDDAKGKERMARWEEGYPKLARRFQDADGFHPRHSFFFPGEQYRDYFLESLANLARQGFGEVEVHLHHNGDNATTLRAQLDKLIDDFSRHGHLSRDKDGRRRYAFIHGNWALANSLPNGFACGVDEELPILWDTGCYADFTFPSVPDYSQPNIVNRIYWPVGDLTQKRCYEQGLPARVGTVMNDRILLIEGPLALARRGRGFRGRIEHSALTAHDPPSLERVRTWAAQSIHVEGRPEWVFVKTHTHGAPDAEGECLLGAGGEALHQGLATFCAEQNYTLHYVTAREMWNIAMAAMEGKSGDPGQYRDHVLPPPPLVAEPAARAASSS